MSDETAPSERLRRSLSWIGLPVLDPDLPQLWGRRPPWQTRSRWVIAPLIALAVALGELFGFTLDIGPILIVALAHAIWSGLLGAAYRLSARSAGQAAFDRLLLWAEVLGDYLAVFCLIHFTGGIESPLTLFLVFHVMLAAIQFSRGTAYLFATWAAAGLWILLLMRQLGALEETAVLFRGEPVLVPEGLTSSILRLVFLTVTFYLTAVLVGQIVVHLRRRVHELGQTTVQLSRANAKLAGLYEIVQAMGTERRLQAILDLVVRRLAVTMDDVAVGIALLEDDGQRLRFHASSGLPSPFVSEARIDRRTSPFHDRVLRGETVVQGRIENDDTHTLRTGLTSIGVRSVALAPLQIEGRSLGFLGLYARTPDRFRGADAGFLEMTADLVAIAIENARANEAIDGLVRDRTQLMLQVAHNLRAPLGATLGLLDLVLSGYTGPIDTRAKEHLERIGERLRSLDDMVGQLLQIAKSRDWGKEIPDVFVLPGELAREIERSFRDEAVRKGIAFTVYRDEDLPAIESGGDLLLRIVENLVSNALRYTPKGGEVEVRFERKGTDMIRIMVRDTGIGIPSGEQANLFREFFRASNAKRHVPSGTGLGLAFVKYAVERHRGHLFLASEEGEGTTVVVELYERRPSEGAVEYGTKVGPLPA